MWYIKLKKGQKLFFTSDTHYHHSNICKGVTRWIGAEAITRPFDLIEEMDDAIVESINSVVGEDDILIHLGDWSFGGFEYIKEFRERILCKNIYLILGNHDHHIERNKENIRDIFTKVSHYEFLTVLDENDNYTYKFALMHYPMCSWHNMNEGVTHLFGHVHLKEDKKIMSGRSLDVGCEGNSLKPYELGEVISLTINRPITPNVLPSDHHVKRITEL